MRIFEDYQNDENDADFPDDGFLTGTTPSTSKQTSPYPEFIDISREQVNSDVLSLMREKNYVRMPE